ncbi:iron ABC transporter permease [Vreelandella andesensis]|uniref:Iron ABC transporter permease n=1 Tax=Vreelandella andesensis TaxID=447567 RepID=A0A433KF96_9GAMM|nr:lipocalin-like domain-containing protein [Halomonas andesensis]RUR27207.1 iron ABC transporter permease [Halomonas andesensis]
MSFPRWLKTLSILAACLMLTGCGDSQESAQPQQTAQDGFAGLGAESQGFVQADASTPLMFPEDHGAHPDYRIEWWYLTANLEDSQGEPLGLQWTLFRQALMPPQERPALTPWAADQVWMAHLGISQHATHVAAERFARSHSAQPLAQQRSQQRSEQRPQQRSEQQGQAGVVAAPFHAWIDDWSFRSPPDANFERFSLSAYHGEGDARSGYDLTLHAEGPLVWHGENGFNAKTIQGQGSHYYSQPFLRIEGSVMLNGESRTVQGRGWLDREWSSQLLTAEQTGWDWFSLHLDDGRKLMAYRLRGGGENGTDYRFAHLFNAAGQTELIGRDSIVLTPLTTEQVAERDIPTRWQLTLPEANLEFTVEARHANRWMPTTVPYWEGDVVVRDTPSQDQIGVGYLEMTGY